MSDICFPAVYTIRSAFLAQQRIVKEVVVKNIRNNHVLYGQENMISASTLKVTDSRPDWGLSLFTF